MYDLPEDMSFFLRNLSPDSKEGAKFKTCFRQKEIIMWQIYLLCSVLILVTWNQLTNYLTYWHSLTQHSNHFVVTNMIHQCCTVSQHHHSSQKIYIYPVFGLASTVLFHFHFPLTKLCRNKTDLPPPPASQLLPTNSDNADNEQR
jgi:hypothetical protein